MKQQRGSAVVPALTAGDRSARAEQYAIGLVDVFGWEALRVAQRQHRDSTGAVRQAWWSIIAKIVAGL